MEGKVGLPGLTDEVLDLVVAVYNKVCRPGVPLEIGKYHFTKYEILEDLKARGTVEYRMGSYLTGHSKIWFSYNGVAPGIYVWVGANNVKYGAREKKLEKDFFDVLAKELTKRRELANPK